LWFVLLNRLHGSNGGISPFSGIYIILIIAVIITSIITTYSWILIQREPQAITDLVVNDIQFYNNDSNEIKLVIQNQGTFDVKVEAVYVGTSPSNCALFNNPTYSPSTQLLVAKSSIEINLNLDWNANCRYYFKIATNKGQVLQTSYKPN